MKSISNDADSHLTALTQSESPEKDLWQLQIAKVSECRLFSWLADHVGDSEKPFIGYQASVAIYLTARMLGHKYKNEIANTIEQLQPT